MNVKRRVYEILEVASEGDRASRRFDICILTLITLNGVALVLETVQSVQDRAGRLFNLFEIFSVSIFTVEYLLRLWCCTTSPDYARPVRGRFKFARTPLALIDFLAILPFYLPWVGVDLRLVRIVRLFRLFRLAKLVRYSTALQTFGRVIQEKKEELLTSLTFLGMMLLLAATLMYFAERDAQPDTFSSIPAAMWWGITTLTTVGYGDAFPITTIGKLIGSVIAVLGIGMFALPTGILGAAFLEEVEHRKAKAKQCPHCGKDLADT